VSVDIEDVRALANLELEEPGEVVLKRVAKDYLES
jgi:hypothetical protein